jgi:hypothetical protein
MYTSMAVHPHVLGTGPALQALTPERHIGGHGLG